MFREKIITFGLLVIMILSVSYLLFRFVGAYREQLVEAQSAGDTSDQAMVAAPSTTETLLGEINFDVEQENTTDDVAVAAEPQPAAVSSENRIKMATMSVNGVVYEGAGTKTLEKGIWHLPGTSTPDRGGNTVLAAHRWKWGPQSGKSFYDIDKVREGDRIIVSWNGKEYEYTVNKISTVNPDQVEILNNSAKAKLTLFSCAPLFSSKYRIVVEADLVNETL